MHPRADERNKKRTHRAAPPLCMDAYSGASAIHACRQSKEGSLYLANLECFPYLTLRSLTLYPIWMWV